MTAKNLSMSLLLALFQNRAAEDSSTPRPCGERSVGKNAPASWSAAVLCRFLEKIATRAGSRLLEDNPAKLLNLQPSICNVGVHRPGRKEFPNG